MNLLSYVDERWFWGTLLALTLAWAGYLFATDPGLRPTERIAGADPAPAPVA